MKIFETLVSASALVLVSTEAARHAEEPHHDWNGTTRAVCTWNVSADGRDESRSSGWIQMSQPRDGPAELSAYIGYLDYDFERDEGRTYLMDLYDLDGEPCEGTKLNTIGRTTSSKKRRGKVESADMGANLNTTDSLIGGYIKLTNQWGGMDACCRIKEYQRYWGEGGPASDNGGEL